MKSLKISIIEMFLLVGILYPVKSQEISKPPVLYEMTWVDVKSYLESNDMVIIPLGSIEQHGLHLPLGTDYLSAYEISKMISAKTGVVVAPILFVGYSAYHEGFPGTMSISTETMEQVVFECVESLMKHGFKRFLFFNGHGGNSIIQNKLIYRIDMTTGANAVSIGYGSPFWPTEGIDYFDWHAGKFETSLSLCLFPNLVKMDKAEKPVIKFSPEVEKMMALSKEYPELTRILEWSMIFAPEETGKKSASHEVSSNGVWSYNDPKDANKQYGEKYINEMVEKAVNLIEAWKLLKKIPPDLKSGG
jgi:creatinine amidohydrolase